MNQYKNKSFEELQQLVKESLALGNIDAYKEIINEVRTRAGLPPFTEANWSLYNLPSGKKILIGTPQKASIFDQYFGEDLQ